MAFATGKSASDRPFRTNINCDIVSADGLSMVIDDDRVGGRSHLLLNSISSMRNFTFATYCRLKLPIYEDIY